MSGPGPAPHAAPTPAGGRSRPGAASPVAPTRRSGRPADRVLDLAPLALVLVAEGSWIAVLYAVPTTGAAAPLSPAAVVFAAAAAFGMLAATYLGLRLGPLWPVAALGVAAALSAAGWLASDAARTDLAAGSLTTALGRHVGGWLLGLAFMRGLAQARSRDDQATGASLVVVGIPAVVVAFTLAGVFSASERAAFYREALPHTVLFAGTGLIGLALLRVRTLRAGFALDWRRNPIWVAALVAAVALIVLFAVPASFVAGQVVMVLLALVPAAMLIASLFSGIDRRSLRTLVTLVAFSIVAIVIVRVLWHGSTDANQQGPSGGGTPPDTTDRTWVVVGWVLLAALAGVVVAVLAAAWMRRKDLGGPAEESGEEREIDRGAEREAVRPSRVRLPRFRRVPPPATAVQAYLAAVHDLSARDGLRREDGETPAEHSGRLRAAAALPSVPGPLARLAADYELARFGGRTINAAEDRRAVGRWHAIREALRERRAAPPPGR